ncbi:MAG: IclR family transcriptional regulator [Acidimicrobiaceae bacterium]|nr:IclR family transcriptional regulator [Acidimicrobiaceae bacterium]
MQKPIIDPNSSRPQYPIASVDNALRLILLLGERSEVRLTDASAYLGVASSTAHRLFAMLSYRGFVRQDPQTKVYQSGAALTNIAFSLLNKLDVRTRARPILERLNEQVEETVHLGVLDGSMVRFVDAIESPRPVRVASRMGKSMYAHCTSTGRAILAQLADEEILRLYPNQDLPQMTEYSISDRNVLMEELGRIRQRGYAVQREESEEGVSSVSMAITSNLIPSRFAINIAVPTTRMTAARIKDIATMLASAGEEMSSFFGLSL